MRGNFLKKLRKTIRDNDMIRGGEGVLLAVSGGPDSVALLRALYLLKEEFNLSFTVAHLNHSCRGGESDAEEAFVRELSALHGLPLIVRKLPAGAIKGEEEAREARYRFLDEAARERSLSKIALGHTADDQAETILMRLLRGAGPTGLKGMAPVREGRFIRPLIDVTRSEVEAFLKGEGLTSRLDSSNLDPRFLRNRIRHELIPYLEKHFNPHIKDTLLALSTIMREEEEFMVSALDKELPRLVRFQGEDRVILMRPPFLLLPPALKLRALRWALSKAGGDLRGVSLRHVIQALSIVEGIYPNRLACLPKGIKVMREYDRIIISRGMEEDPFARLDFSYPLQVPGTTTIPEAGAAIRAELVEGEVHELPLQAAIACMDWDKIVGAIHELPLLYVRSPRPGDRFRPLGMGGSRKVQDFFVDAKVPRAERWKRPLVVCGERIVWVPGWRIAQGTEVGPDTRKILRLEFIEDL